VQGSGNSTVGKLVAQRLDVPFVDGDSLHSVANKKWMASGHAPSEVQRVPWLREVGGRLTLKPESRSGMVVACSALKRHYRDVLREQVPSMFTVFADGDQDMIYAWIMARYHEFMPPSLLRTQFDDLEERQLTSPASPSILFRARIRLSIR
jgi:gluconokinase